MNPKMKQLVRHAFAICCVLGLVACSKEHIDTPATDKNTVNTTVGNLQFSFTEHDFGAEESLNTRTALAAKPQKMDLGDDLEADVTVEEEAPAPSTRASKPMSDGTYTIIAYKTDGTRYGSTLLKGTVTSGVFTVDPAFQEKMYLPDGETLTFVCFNDKVTDDGTNLTVSAVNVADALVGTTTVTMAINQRQTISFEMKHPGARIRTKIIAMMGIGNDIKASFATPATAIPTHARYNSRNQDYVATATANYQQTISYPKAEWDWVKYNTEPELTIGSACAYEYFLPHTPIGTFKLTFTEGKLYQKALNGNTLSFTQPIETVANHSYCINIKIKFKGFKYLFHDGSVGRLNDPAIAGKTPIGVVVRENNGTPNSGFAMSLSEPAGEYYWTTNPNGYNEHNSKGSGRWFDFYGYEYTYDPSYARNGTPHYLDPKFPAFQAAGAYEPTASSLDAKFKKGKWYLPSTGNWALMMSNLGLVDVDATGVWGPGANRYYYFLDKELAQIGAKSLIRTYHYDMFMLSTELDSWNCASGRVGKTYQELTQVSGDKRISGYVRPFVNF